MSALLQRTDEERREQARPSRAPGRRSSAAAATLRVTALVVTATLPFGRVFVTSDWFVPLVLAAVLPVAVSFAARRIGLRWWGALAASAVAALWYAALVLLPSTLWGGVVPTVESARLALRVAIIGAERIAVLPAPVYPEVPLLLLALAGVWSVSTCIDVLAVRLESPGKAIICAATLWIVPLAIVPGGDAAWVLAAPLLLAAAAVMLAQAERDFTRWGAHVTSSGTGPAHARVQRQSSGVVLAVCALVAGMLVAGLLPGFGDPPWYELRARSTTTLTDNPIVQLRTNLVASDSGPVMRVRSSEPVYLRSTALDAYADTEVWQASTIEPQPLDDGIVPGGHFTNRQREVRVQVVDVTDGVLVPAPAGPLRFEAPRGIRPRYDERTSTFTFGEDRLQSGQRYSVVSSRPHMDPDVVASLDAPAPARLTELPDSVPPEVGQLARRIVDDADATTPFTQALAIQNELRTWEYSLSPPAGHSGVAMRTFLEQRVGYCEQFAGTMAVMLRTLDIPARVAVGFTPGTVDPNDPTLWTVSWSNAHAWVEVRFGGEWLAFEPTPRADGNVLVPSVSDLAPANTAQAPDVTTANTGDTTTQEQFDIFDERRALQDPGQTTPQGGVLGGNGGQVPERLTDPALGLAVVLLLVAAVLALVALGRRAAAVTEPADRILAVREGIGRLGRGLGVPAPAWETDREYLLRLAPDADPARELMAAVTSARYAAAVDTATADRAERAGEALGVALLADRPRWQRIAIRLRGDAAAGWQRLRRAVRRNRRGP